MNEYTNVIDSRLRLSNMRFGDTFYLDEVFVKIEGVQYYLWSVVDEKSRNATAAKRFFKRLLKRSRPRKIVTDKLKSYGVAHRKLMPDVIHDTTQYANRAELSHQSTRARERGMRKFKSISQAQRFLIRICKYLEPT